MSKKVTCTTCYNPDAILEDEEAQPGTAEYVGSIFCPYCESGLADAEG